ADACVFISHCSADRKFVDAAVHSFFKSHNIDTWFSPQDIPGGADWYKHIMEGLNKSDWFVIVMTPRSHLSDWVRKEVELALETKRGRILPILMEKCDLKKIHPELETLHYEDFTTDVPRS